MLWCIEYNTSVNRLRVPDRDDAKKGFNPRDEHLECAGSFDIRLLHNLLLEDQQTLDLLLSLWLRMEYYKCDLSLLAARVTKVLGKCWKIEGSSQSV